MPLGYNRVLGDAGKSAESRPHRVGIANWPTQPEDPRSNTFAALVSHLAGAGYEGLELSTVGMERYFPGDSTMVIARKARTLAEAAGLEFFGSTLHVTDDSMRKLHWIEPYAEQVKGTKEMGGQYASYQVFIHPDYFETAGAYRKDEEYLTWCAQRVTELRDMTWGQGLNFYLEIHVNRISEDPQALCRILDMACCELNGDLSHFIARGFMRGEFIDRIMPLVNHTHVRMARQYGDLSAGVPDPKADWKAKGVTWQMFNYMKPALSHGLSSRAIIGETGAMHLVKDTLTQDAMLVPLYRAMARYADAAAQGIVMKVESPEDLKPWG